MEQKDEKLNTEKSPPLELEVLRVVKKGDKTEVFCGPPSALNIALKELYNTVHSNINKVFARIVGKM